MPAFDAQTQFFDEPDWLLLQNGHVHLYWQEEVLAEELLALSEHGYRVYSFDARDWATSEDMLIALGQALSFPNYYGQNLNALNDCLGDVAHYEYGASPADKGTCLVVRHYETFTERSPEVAHALLDIIATQARHGTLVGHRMLLLVQTEDARAKYAPVGATPVMWNLREVSSARRGL